MKREGSGVGEGVRKSRYSNHNDMVNLNLNPPATSKEIMKDKEWITVEKKKKKSKAIIKERET